MRSLRGGVVGLALVAPALVGCVESSVYERAAAQVDAGARAAQQKDQQIRMLEWQAAVLGQQLREAQLREAAALRDLGAQVRELAAANAALQERVRREEEERARLGAATEDPKGPGDRRAAELRRMTAALDAQNARILDRLRRLEAKIDARAGEARGRGGDAARPAPGDGGVIDPWGFGARK